MGRRQIRRSLKTRDPGEAKRLFIQAHAELEREMAEAEARVAAQKVGDEISADRAKSIVDEFIRTRHTRGLWKRWPTLGLTYWLEEEARGTFGIDFPIGAGPRGSELDVECIRGLPLLGDCWLDVVRQCPPGDWLQSSLTVLDPVFEMLGASVKRVPANELLIMQAWNARLRDDNERLRADVDAPRRAGSRPRLRPDLRFRELLKLWRDEKKPRPSPTPRSSVRPRI